MRLHRLELAALGPFAGAEVIDLDRLGRDGLFLLHGSTGAGKTTVLDAIAYALHGRVPGPRQLAGRLRCDYADAGVRTSVRLELTLCGRRVRITRTPEWQRPKRRGDGLTREPASAILETATPSSSPVWTVVSTRIDEVSQQLLDWIGMSAEQFFQVVLLPQGDFARFLRAESTEREELLERLFGTARYTAATEWLADRRADAKLALQATESELHLVLVRLCQAAGRSAAPDPSLADAAWRSEVRVEAAEAVRATAGDEVEAAAGLAGASCAVEAAVRSAELQGRVTAARAELAAVLADAGEHSARQVRLAAARRAESIRALLAHRSVAAAELAAAQEDVRRCAAAVSVAAPAGADGTGERRAGTDLPGWERAVRREAALLEALLAEEVQLPALLAEAAAAEQAAAQLAGRMAAGRLRAAELPDLAEAALQARVQAQQAAAALPEARAGVAQLEQAAQSARTAAGADREVADLRERRIAAVERHQSTVAASLELRRRRLDGMAAELAAGLIEGDPCAVCGSTEHPRPADRAVDAVSSEHEQTAARSERAAAEDRDRAEEALAAARSAAAGHHGRSGGRAAADLDGHLDTARAVLAHLSLLAAALPERTALCTQLGHDQADLVGLLADAGRAQAEQLERASATRRAADALAGRIDRARGSDAAVADRRARLLALADDVAAWCAAEEAVGRATAADLDAATAVQAASIRAGFGDAASAVAAVLDEGEQQRLEGVILDHERRLAAAQDRMADPVLADPLVQALAEAPPIDVDGPARAREAAVRTHLAAATGHGAATARVTEIDRLLALLAAADEAAAPARAAHAEIRALADLVAGAGANTRSMTLRAYVLAARLADVAAAASVRLAQMTGGRYTLHQTETADSRRPRAGLGLLVRDDFSGLTRSTRTLSGGESFLASLALALGLADVVTAESGGIELETLFIDEGFGSLDAETLDLVMSTLDELRAGGRVVGVVSHVEEMRSRIPSRLHVVADRTGSHLEIACA